MKRWALVLWSSLLGGATFHTDFESGSLGRVEEVNPRHFRLAIKGETDQNGRNRQASWYCFRVEGAPLEAMTLELVDLPGEYDGKPNQGAITGDTPPVISYDGKTWKHVKTVEYDDKTPLLRVVVTPEKPRFWIAHVPAYNTQNLERLRREVSANPAFRERVIGKTLGGRDLYLWTITDRKVPDNTKKTVFLMFRQHAWETGSSWVGEGAVRGLLAEVDLQREVLWKILPLCDPDGVARGGVRFNAKGYDLNRNWDVVDREKMPEISAERKAVGDWIQSGNKVDLFLSLHNTETSEYLEAPPEKFKPLAEVFFEALTAHTSFDPTRPLLFADPKRMTVAGGLYKDYGIPAFLMEQRIAYNAKLKGLPLPEDRMKFGRELVWAIWSALTGGGIRK